MVCKLIIIYPSKLILSRRERVQLGVRTLKRYTIYKCLLPHTTRGSTAVMWDCSRPPINNLITIWSDERSAESVVWTTAMQTEAAYLFQPTLKTTIQFDLPRFSTSLSQNVRYSYRTISTYILELSRCNL